MWSFAGRRAPGSSAQTLQSGQDQRVDRYPVGTGGRTARMDPTEQVYEADATPVQRGLYADIKTTFRAPIVNSIWRTLVAHEPDLAVYIWGQVKPAFQTREFGALSIAVRDRILSAVEHDLPHYEPADVDLEPSAWTELRSQATTFDVVGPRLAVLFTLMDRRLREGDTGTTPGGRNTTAPFPTWLDRDRGRPPTMVSQSDARAVMPDTLAEEFGEMVPSVYRCLAQWPPFLDRAASDLRPLVESADVDDARSDAVELVETYLDRLPYTPRVDPEALAAVGADEATIAELQDLFATFRAGGETVLPRLHVYPATVGAAGERESLAFP